jgi:hypothetical protein
MKYPNPVPRLPHDLQGRHLFLTSFAATAAAARQECRVVVVVDGALCDRAMECVPSTARPTREAGHAVLNRDLHDGSCQAPLVITSLSCIHFALMKGGTMADETGLHLMNTEN